MEAEIVVGVTGGDRALAMPAYETATGHPIPAALWPVTEVRSDSATDQLILKTWSAAPPGSLEPRRQRFLIMTSDTAMSRP
jgi:hypothetical protein